MGKAPKKVFMSVEFTSYYESLDDSNKHRKWIELMRDSLLENMLIGENIRKDRIPKAYTRKYDLKNLYRFAHPEGYRSIYTIQQVGEDGVCPVLLDFVSHKKYERTFDYQGLL